MAEFDELPRDAERAGARGRTLDMCCGRYGGSKSNLTIKRSGDAVEFVLLDHTIHRVLSIRTASAAWNILLTHADRIFCITTNRIKPDPSARHTRLIEEFMKKRTTAPCIAGLVGRRRCGDSGPIKRFSMATQTAASKSCSGVNKLPWNLCNPDTNVLLTANTNAGDKQEGCFDAAVMRHLAHSVPERVRQYQELKGLKEDIIHSVNGSLVTFFVANTAKCCVILSILSRLDHLQQRKQLMEFVEWSGKGADRPIAYATIETNLLLILVPKSARKTGFRRQDTGAGNFRLWNRVRIVRLMISFGRRFFVGSWVRKSEAPS